MSTPAPITNVHQSSRLFSTKEDTQALKDSVLHELDSIRVPNPKGWRAPDLAPAQERALRHIGKDGPTQQPTGDHALDDAQARRQVLFHRAIDTPMSPYEITQLRGGKHFKKYEPLALNSPEYTALLKRTFDEVFRSNELTLDDTTNERIRAGWRIVREMARSKRLIQLDEPLLTAIFTRTPTALDMWTMPTEVPTLNQSFEYLGKPDTTANPIYLQLCADALRLKSDYWPWAQAEITTTTEAPDPDDINPTDDPDDHYFDKTAPARFCPAPEPFVLRAGLPLLPPPVPLKFYDASGQITDLYDTRNDPGLKLYIRAVDTTADYLGIYHGSAKDPEAGRRGMMGLTNAQTCRIAFPTRMQMIAWEYILINQTLKLLVKHGGRITYNYLIEHYGFNHSEVNGVLRMTKKFAKELVNADRAEDRALMLLRCEDLMRRARNSMDHKAEQNAMKQMSMILGLTRTEEDETLSDFVQIVKTATEKRITTRNAFKLAAPKDDPAFDLRADD